MTIHVDKKTFAIGLLSLTAIALLFGNLGAPQPAEAAQIVKGRDYQMITARTQQGDDGLYVVENRTGLMAVFLYNLKGQRVEPIVVKPIMDAFTGGAAPLGPPRGGR